MGGWLKALFGTYIKNVVSACLITGGAVKGVVRVFKHVNWFFTRKQVNKACYKGSKKQIRLNKSVLFLLKSLLSRSKAPVNSSYAKQWFVSLLN